MSSLEKQIATILSLKEYQPGAYTIKYTADYKLDDMLEAGVTDEAGLLSWAGDKLFYGLPVSMNGNTFGCAAFLVTDENGNHLMGRNLDYPEADCLMIYCDPKDGFDSIAMVDLSIVNIGSGEGMFRKDDEAVAQWSLALVEQCASRQREILNAVWPALKSGGLLIYSTCTYNKHENEEMVDYIINNLGATVVEVPINSEWNITPAIGRDYACYRFMPHMTQGEGLFMCVLRKNHCATTNLINEKRKDKKGTKNSTLPIPDELKKWINGNYFVGEANGIVTATPTHIKEHFNNQYKNLHIIKDFGTEVGLIKGKKIVPSHQLAMSANLATDTIATVEVDYPTAISYLRGEAICIEGPKGYVLIRFKGAVLGWANNLGTRANNLYPKPWRIMSTYVPNIPPSMS